MSWTSDIATTWSQFASSFTSAQALRRLWYFLQEAKSRIEGLEAAPAATGSTVSDAATNTLTDAFVLTHATSATAEVGFSTGLLFRGENSAGAAMDIARISANEAGVSPGSEKGGLDFWVRTGGAVLAKKWQLSGSGNWVVDTDNAYALGSNTLRLAASNAVAFRVHGAAGDVNRVAELSTFGLGLGQGGATAMDWYLAHASVVQRADMASGNILGAVGAGGFACRTLAADAQPTSSLSDATLLLGAGGASAPDVRVRRTTAKTLTFDDGAGGALTVVGVGGGGGALTPGVVPDLLTAGMPVVGCWWLNAPAYGGIVMLQPHSGGYGYGVSLFGPLAIAADPIGIQVDSVAAVNQGCGWYNLSTAETSLAHRPWIRIRVKVSATATDQSVFVGWNLVSGPPSPFGAGGSTIATDSVLLMVDNTTGSWGDTTWKIRSRAAGAITTIDTAVPYTASHDYELYLQADATTVTWSIYDRTAGVAYGATGVAIANAPASSAGLGAVYYGMSGAGGASLRLTWGPCTRGHFGPA